MGRDRILFDDRTTGRQTLQRMASVERYNSWVYSRIAPCLGRRLLEVGCGLGNMTGYFADRELVVALDKLRESVQLVRDQYGRRANVVVLEGDICDPSVVDRLRGYSVDTAICINVLEHIEEDILALKMMARVVGPGGRILVLAPAGSYLYGSLDIGLGHFRRYSLAALLRKMESASCRIETAYYMNVAGIPGWFLNSRILKRSLLSRRMLRLFNLLVPLLDPLERALRPPFGLSVLAAGTIRCQPPDARPSHPPSDDS